VITLAFAVGTGYPHTTFGLYVTAFVLAVVVIGGLRAAYELVTRDLWRLAGVRRRAVLLGPAERLVDLRRALGLGRAASTTTSSAPSRTTSSTSPCPCSAASPSSRSSSSGCVRTS